MVSPVYSLPPLPYLLVLLLAVGLVGAALYRTRPAIGTRHVVALSTWMVAGACLRVLHAVGAVPDPVAPFLGSPAVYLATAVLAGSAWLAGLAAFDDGPGVASTAGFLGLTGSALALALVALGLAFGAANGPLRIVVPLAGLLAAIVVAAAVWALMGRTMPGVTATTGAVGALVVFGHALDAVSTAVGVDLLPFAEQSPLSRSIIEFAAGLPTAAFLGSGWLFVVVKVTLAVFVVRLVADYVRDDPREGYLLLGFVAAVGLGPGAHNLLLFVIAG